jgi:hypothetical protein
MTHSIPPNDPYRYYTGQQGYSLKDCQAFEAHNAQKSLCQLTVTQNQNPEGKDFLTSRTDLTDQYLSLDDPVTKRVVACQNIAPTYYPDMTQEMIGKRPVYSSRNTEYNIPAIIYKNRDNSVNRRFECQQPVWSWDCS